MSSVGVAPLEVVPATPDRAEALASVFGRAFVDDPMMRWSLGVHADFESCLRRCFTCFLEQVLAFIAFGLARARANGVGAWLSAGVTRNVDIYGRCGFRVVEEAHAPDGGPTVYFMRWDP